MNCFYALNAGEADCFVLQFSDQGQNYTIVLDGGSKLEPVVELPAFLKELGVEKIDLMILTHLHQDHLGFLPDVACTLPVRQAVLPYKRFDWAEDTALDEIYGKQTAFTIRESNLLYDSLSRTAKPSTTFPLEGISEFHFGRFTMKQIYPYFQVPSPYLAALIEAHDAPQRQEGALLYEEKRKCCNCDSSVWLLKKDDVPAVLFCADAIEENIYASLQEAQVGHVDIVKLSHHGRNKPPYSYFSAELVSMLSPKQIIVATDEDRYITLGAQWRELYPAAQLFATCEAASALKFML